MTWVFSTWAAFRSWQEAFPPWKQRVLYAILAAYLAISADILL